jgi:uncharacterized protein (UPF0332 family)
MSICAEDFYTSALELAKLKEEVSLRNCLSRAYYGAYHTAKTVVPPESYDYEDGKKAGSHKRYIDQLLQGENGSFERQLGVKLLRLYDRRITADYHLNKTVIQADVAVQLNTTKDAFDLVTTKLLK